MKNFNHILISVFIVLSMLMINELHAQGISVNDSSTPPDPSAMLDISSVSSGVLVPRMTAIQRGAIVDPATGLLVYQTDEAIGFWFYNGSVWSPVAGSQASSHYIGEHFGGGVIFHLFKDENGIEHGLILAFVDLSEGIQWSNVTSGLIGTGAQSKWDGASNCSAIIAQDGHTESAAQLCLNYTNPDYGSGVYSDWYLPAISELGLVYDVQREMEFALAYNGEDNFQPLDLYYYWSSTEFDADISWTFHFEGGYASNFSEGKNDSNTKVRAIRSF